MKKTSINFKQGILKTAGVWKNKKSFWNNLWEKIKISRSFVGKRGNLSAIIAEDRQNH